MKLLFQSPPAEKGNTQKIFYMCNAEGIENFFQRKFFMCERGEKDFLKSKFSGLP